MVEAAMADTCRNKNKRFNIGAKMTNGTGDGDEDDTETVLDQNRELIKKVNENHQSKIADNLVKNVGWIREINGNISKLRDFLVCLLILPADRRIVEYQAAVADWFLVAAADFYGAFWILNHSAMHAYQHFHLQEQVVNSINPVGEKKIRRRVDPWELTGCGCFTRKFKVIEAPPPPDVKAAFQKYAEGGNQMTAEQLCRFLVDVQGQSGATVADAEEIALQVLQKRHHMAKFRRHAWTLDDFYQYLFSAYLNPPMDTKVHHDMTAPLSHYFVFTGHNSYLTGNQLSSDCSDVPVIKALKRGVRVVELDLWPNSTKDDVHVLHGRTLTTPVELNKCLTSIKEHAFSASEYPVIITLADHLTLKLQAKVAQMISQTFGKMLFCRQSEAQTNKDKDKEKEKNSDDDVWGKEPAELVTDREDDKTDSDASENNQDEEETDASEPELNSSRAPGYKSLIAINAEKPKGGVKNALKVDLDKVKQRRSLIEQALEKLQCLMEQMLFQFPQKHSNEPNATLDSPRGISLEYIPRERFYMGDGWNLDFKKTHFDTYSPPDFYTKVSIAGVPADETMKKTKTKEDNWKPVWDEEFVFPLTVPELALLRIEVHEYDMSEKDDFADAEAEFQGVLVLEENIEDKGGQATSRCCECVPSFCTKQNDYLLQFLILLSTLRITILLSSGCMELKWGHGMGKHLCIMQGMFKANGGCGYVKKPHFLLQRGPNNEVKVILGEGWTWHQDFHHTAFDRPDFYARIGIAGAPADKDVRQTATIEYEWLTVWEEFEFLIRVTELAVLPVLDSSPGI
ncbi:Phosphoinositide phospholipase C 4 [Hibiscus syriacus]|uniref:Phosphoinositide phospholipase C n=1 Tax=Hibiscus syriacus TaxID=106335 RepID=A0A6A2WXP8_HIBSY|nr:Phosphoinositide phospholipase C 4 [Hibiscus syriacus]